MEVSETTGGAIPKYSQLQFQFGKQQCTNDHRTGQGWLFSHFFLLQQSMCANAGADAASGALYPVLYPHPLFHLGPLHTKCVKRKLEQLPAYKPTAGLMISNCLLSEFAALTYVFYLSLHQYLSSKWKKAVLILLLKRSGRSEKPDLFLPCITFTCCWQRA